MIITQVHLVLGTIEGHSKMCNFVTQHNATCLKFCGSVIDMLIACMASCVGVWLADVNIVNRVPHGGSGVMLWAGINYEQRTQLHFIDGSLNAQRHRDKIMRPIVVPFIHRHHLMFQHDKWWSHQILTGFLIPTGLPCPYCDQHMLICRWVHQSVGDFWPFLWIPRLTHC
jgi:hypothetical protein